MFLRPDMTLGAIVVMLSCKNSDGKVYVRAFPSSLLRQALKWFHKLPSDSIDCWQDIMDLFMNKFGTSIVADEDERTLMERQQKPGETLRRRIYAQLEDKRILPKSHKIKLPPNRRDEKNYCEYHKDHGHDTDEFRLLKADIEKLIRQGQLKEFVRRYQGSPLRRRERTPPWRNIHINKDHNDTSRITGRVDTISGGIAGGGDTSNARRKYARRSMYALAPITTIDR
ncbi:hypothetical protein LIER_36976 [Lithospermum erythrorhizon]|uniref:Retrotransposon gag domain-containing protein n=1 Tax=Lithospermum erythrorhizon TaxID=34254 RepID=A0AAV3PEN5_LITER